MKIHVHKRLLIVFKFVWNENIVKKLTIYLNHYKHWQKYKEIGKVSSDKT